MEVEFAVLHLKSERFVEFDGGEILLPNVEIYGPQVLFGTSKGDDVFHQQASQPLSAKVGMNDDPFDVAHHLFGGIVDRFDGREHKFGFGGNSSADLCQEDHCLFVDGGLD